MAPDLQALPESRIANQLPRNPFEGTKADDFSDAEIAQLWVDWPGTGGFEDVLSPRSAMPLILVGGKGSGKTHILRHFATPAPIFGRDLALFEEIAKSGYVGVYFRCAGLNASRFTGKGQSAERWAEVFEYFMELWLGELTLELVQVALATCDDCPQREAAILERLAPASDVLARFSRISDAIDWLRKEQSGVNLEVNNCASTGKLKVTVRVTRGALVFGIPRAVTAVIPEWQHVHFVYMADEFENLLVHHQAYVQTLVRERQYPTTFRIGVRRYGVRTYDTYAAGEQNRLGSDFDEVDLDQRLRRAKNYPRFARSLVLRRLVAAGLVAANTGDEYLDQIFETHDPDPFAREETSFVIANYETQERPYFVRLRRELLQYADLSESEVDDVIENLQRPDIPLIEKANIFLLYRQWNSGITNFVRSARQIARDADRYLKRDRETLHATIMRHWRADLLAQLYRDCKQPLRYSGLDTLVDMSSGFPRNLLVILKNAVRFAAFEGHEPFVSGPISRRAQNAAVRESAEWFFRDAGVASPDAPRARAAVRKLATLFRTIRYSDLPAECSLSTFTVRPEELTGTATAVIRTCETWSLLVRITAGQKDKNTEEIHEKYQLNPMICPLWELPLARRGALHLSQPLADAVFGSDSDETFDQLLAERVRPLNVPFGKPARRSEAAQIDLLS